MLILIKIEKANSVDYQKLLNAIARAAHLLGKQGMVYPRHREDIDDNFKNLENFLCSFEISCSLIPRPRKHLKILKNKNAIFLSPRSQER